MNTFQPCACGSGRTFAACCGPVIDGTVVAPTAEALMRSRYTAYAVGRIDHVERTHAPETRDQFDRAEAEDMGAVCHFETLEVHRAEENGETGVVEFSVRYRIHGISACQRETSVFRRENGAWLYVSSTSVSRPVPVSRTPKVGRNDPCPCGSGKKYKKCCGAHGA